MVYHNRKNSGQVALIVLLLMIVILTIGLSLASRSITDIKISQDEKESLRAFSAAEAGVEKALNDLPAYVGTTTEEIGGIETDITVAPVGDGAIRPVEQGESTSILLTGSVSNSLTIYWIDKSKPDEMDTKASLEITVFDEDGGFDTYAYNPEASMPSRDNGFLGVGADGGDFYRQVNVNINRMMDPLDVVVRIKALYDKTTIKVNSSSVDLAVQQYNITSSALAEGSKTGSLIVDRTIAVLPSIFDYILFSGNSSLE